jgi:hypothetical protein
MRPRLRDVSRLTYSLVDVWMDSYTWEPTALTLDIDDTCDSTACSPRGSTRIMTGAHRWPSLCGPARMPGRDIGTGRFDSWLETRQIPGGRLAPDIKLSACPEVRRRTGPTSAARAAAINSTGLMGNYGPYAMPVLSYLRRMCRGAESVRN